MKLNKKLLVITTIIILLPIIIGLIFWEQLPAEMATHWGTDNEPDGWTSKIFTVFGIPAVIAVLHIVCLLVTYADPKKSNIGQKAMGIVYWILPATSIAVMSATYAYALGMEVNIGMICCLLMGIIFIALGNYLPKAKLNYTFGYKIPWTLNSDENWNKTHRLAGWLMVICGFAFIINAFILSKYIFVVCFAVAIIPIIYSYILYKKGI
ncbi:MAG: SdpI family protein [Oscillospiraceae bacterium]|nr:SdpI family protein [Oscillospiraceae bacterium]